MEITEIGLLVIGVAAFVASFVIPEKKGKVSEQDKRLGRETIQEMVEAQMEGVQTRISEAVDETVRYAVEKTERSMERLSNEKIMEVSEYSDTVINEIHKNHEEVVFLYDMLNDKHKNMTQAAAEVEKKAKEAVETVEKKAEETAVFAKKQQEVVEEAQDQASGLAILARAQRQKREEEDRRKRERMEAQEAARRAEEAAIAAAAAAEAAKIQMQNHAEDDSFQEPVDETGVEDMGVVENIDEEAVLEEPVMEMTEPQNPVEEKPSFSPIATDKIERIVLNPDGTVNPPKALTEMPINTKAKEQVTIEEPKTEPKAKTENRPVRTKEKAARNARTVRGKSKSASSIREATLMDFIVNKTKAVPEVTEEIPEEVPVPAESGTQNNNERILALHQAGKTNVAIAKELGLGVGEVKLVIDLFKGI